MHSQSTSERAKGVSRTVLRLLQKLRCSQNLFRKKYIYIEPFGTIKPILFGYYKRQGILLTKDILADAGQFQILFLLFACLLSAKGLQLYKERKVMNQTRTCANNENSQ